MNEVAPAFGLGNIGQVEHEAGLDQLLGLAAVVELGGAHGLAADDAADDDRPRGTAGTGDGTVDPVVVGLVVESLGKFGHGRGLAAGRPPVCDFQIGGLGGHAERQRHGRRQSGLQDAQVHRNFPPL